MKKITQRKSNAYSSVCNKLFWAPKTAKFDKAKYKWYETLKSLLSVTLFLLQNGKIDS